MLERNLFLFGFVDMNEGSVTERVNELADIQNAPVHVAYKKLFSNTWIEQFINMDLVVKGLGEILVGAFPGRAWSFVCKKNDLDSPRIVLNNAIWIFCGWIQISLLQGVEGKPLQLNR